MRSLKLLLAFLCMGALPVIIGCPNIPNVPPVTGPYTTFDSTSGLVPLPNNLLMVAPDPTNPATWHLNVPVMPTDSELTKELKANMNQLDGWTTGSAITIPFASKIDETTIKDNTVLLDISGLFLNPPDPTKVARVPNSTYFAFFNKGLNPATIAPYYLTIRFKSPAVGKPPNDFTMGHVYMVVLKSGLKDVNGVAFVEYPALYFMSDPNPLVDENGISLVEPFLNDDQANQLEPAREFYGPLFQALDLLKQAGSTNGISQSDAVTFSAFSIQSGPRALFDGSANLPSPIDFPYSSNAPVNVHPSIYFDQAIDKTTLTASTVKIYEAPNALHSIPALIELSDITVEPVDANGKYKLVITPKNNLLNSQQYLVFLTNGIKGLNGVKSEPTSTFGAVRSCEAYQAGSTYACATPLITQSGSTITLNSPYLDATLDVLIGFGKDPATATQAEWQAAYTYLLGQMVTLQGWQSGSAPLFYVAASFGIKAQTITATWAFTTTAP